MIQKLLLALDMLRGIWTIALIVALMTTFSGLDVLESAGTLTILLACFMTATVTYSLFKEEKIDKPVH